MPVRGDKTLRREQKVSLCLADDVSISILLRLSEMYELTNKKERNGC
jgi:hypothetical protein